MRALFAYLLIGCLFFVKGTAPVAPGAQQYNKACSFQQIEGSVAFAGEEHPLYTEEFSFFTDDNEEDDEASSERKKAPASNGHTSFMAACLKGHPLSFTDSPACFHGNAGNKFPDKYLLYRAIRI